MSRLSFKSLLFIVGGSWLVFCVVAFLLCGHREQFGQFGDAFGVLNSLFSGLAFVVIYRTLVEETDRKTEDAKNAQRQAELHAMSTLASITQALWENNRDTANAITNEVEKLRWQGFAGERYKELMEIRNRLSALIATETAGSSSTPTK